MESYRIALVEYLNTLPFSEGFRQHGLSARHTIIPAAPSKCASLFERGEVDISLCPIGALDELPPHEIAGRYCIGAEGPVRTVMLFSKVPLEKIETVTLDADSRTSNILLQILASRYWNYAWQFETPGEPGGADSCLMIGDKVFTHGPQYPFQYDLAETWQKLTGLPMVFAVWITRPGIDPAMIGQIDSAFEAGMKFIRSQESRLSPWQVEYLTQNISYPLDDGKRKALSLFRTWARKAELVSSEV